jgi:IS1 family transposase
VRVNRLELDELWSFVAKKQARVQQNELFAKGDQYVFIGMAGTQKAIIGFHVGKRDTDNTDQFIRDLRERVVGLPEISTDGFLPYRNAIRDAFGNRIAHGVVHQNLQRNQSCHPRSGATLQPGSGSSCKPQRSKRRASRDFDQLRGARQSFDPHGVPALHAANERF